MEQLDDNMFTDLFLILEVDSLHEGESVLDTFCEFCFPHRNSKMIFDQNYSHCLETLKQCQLLEIVERLFSLNLFIGPSSQNSRLHIDISRHTCK